MTEILDAQNYGLAKRVKLVQLENNTIGIVKKRKSRIIMKDGRQILDIAQQIRNVDTNASIALLISGPICSKTTKLLSENNIEIILEA
jgi:hypothetical protein